MGQIDFASEIRDRITMRECLDRYGIEINRAGFARCPFHSADRTPSLKVYPSNRGWNCFGCGQSGSVIDFVMQYFNEDFKSACVRMNDDFSLGLPIDSEKPPTYRERKKLTQRCREREESRRAEAEEIEQADEAYRRALEFFCACDFLLIHSPLWSHAWCKALKCIAIAEHDLNLAEMGVQLIRERQRNSDTRLVGR